ncbi:aspartate/glutamate racemase family protein [Mucilaginibacter rubeus]|uniref:Aspartate/glutamate racemase family protein n=1 Tax=Mucilaginibacter rubeus TaxID=2027860 RepID=A0A5C1I2S8_9SPHI|nr:amino acid racemase [Mucilaginibacter rubeus]QEM12502.1 aspartate/glutamate racemase family protein [Mucilaginibacter rubeus]
MLSNQLPTIGIVGGMGPRAGNALFERVICNTRASTDQQHLPVVVMSFPSEITDRTAFLKGITAENPAYAIVKIIQKLAITGAGVVGIACNTSHSALIYDIIEEELFKRKVDVKLLHMPNETCLFIKSNYPEVKRVGLMATNGTYETGLYQQILKGMGYDVVLPDLRFQNNVIHRMIYHETWGLKASHSVVTDQVYKLFDEALSFFKARDTDAIILGCTELSLLVKDNTMRGMQLIDSTDCLARALVNAVTTNTVTINAAGLASEIF